MKTSDYDYHLPPELIAQTPVEPRDSARLLVLDRASGAISHRVFRELPDLLRPDDVLVANDSRVLPARLRGRRAETGGAVEALLLHEERPDEWVALVKPGRRVRPGERLVFGDGLLTATVLERLDGGERRLRLEAAEGTVREAIHSAGATPLPPYIHAPLRDPERYQTVYARDEGSVAAPTAGLHFTPELLERLQARGVALRRVTLHVGAGTFKPMSGEDVEEHTMHSEWATLDAETADYLNTVRAEGRRVIAVGTTTVRVLETAASTAPGSAGVSSVPISESAGVSPVPASFPPEGADVRDAGERQPAHADEDGSAGVLRPFTGWTDVFIKPGYTFRAVDGLITNFHLPRSTLLLLVSAFAGKENIDRAYAAAIAARYRFYSFGDAMLLL